jgi:putative ABC transport system permease protein
MLFLATKNFFQEKTRTIISIGGVAFSVVLIMVLQGLYQGWSNKIGEYIKTVPADLWIMQAGAEDMFHTPSVLSLDYERKIKAINGVASVNPFTGRRVVFQVSEEDVNMYVVGYDKVKDTGKPARVVEGKSVPDEGEIIVDRVPAKTKNIRVGDTLNIAERQFKVVGLSEGGDVVTFSFAFATQEETQELQKLPDATNFFLVTLVPGANIESVRAEIMNTFPELAAVTKETFVANNTKIISDSFLPVIFVLLLIGIAVGIAVIGLTIFTSTVEKAKEYGVLKAIGMRNRQLYTVVMQQALIAGILGFILGVILAFILQIVVGAYVPQFVSQIQPRDIIWIFFLTITMSIVASYIPIRRISSIDPAEVFKS